MAFNLKQGAKQQESLLADSYAKQRMRLKGQQTAATQQVGQNIDRLQARTGAMGGSIEKARNKAYTGVAKEFADTEAALGAEEASQLAALKGRQQELGLQQSQFKDTMKEQKRQFSEQLKYQWAEMDENKKTNFINAAIALKEAGLKSSNDWNALFSGLQGVYGDRVPKNFGIKAPQVGTSPFYRKDTYQGGY